MQLKINKLYHLIIRSLFVNLTSVFILLTSYSYSQSIKNEASFMSKTPVLYYIDKEYDDLGNVVESWNETIENPSDELIRKQKVLDSVYIFTDLNLMVLDSINKLRSVIIEVDSIRNFDYVQEVLFEKMKDEKKSLLVKEIYGPCNTSCEEFIIEILFSSKRLKRRLLSKRTKSISISTMRIKDKADVILYYSRGFISFQKVMSVEL